MVCQVTFSFFPFWTSSIFKSGTFCSRVGRQKNQRTLIFFFYGLAKHETYWQMLELDISCHATSLSLFSHWMFLEVAIFFMLSQIFSMSRNKENRRSHDLYFTEVIICLWIVNVDTQLIFCGTSIFSYQWNSRCILPFKDSISLFFLSYIPTNKYNCQATMFSLYQILPSQGRRIQLLTLKNSASRIC